MSVIYKPAGRAAEYAEWACNLFRGCPHACAYCFAPSMLRMKKYEFHKEAAPRKDILKRLAKDAKAHEGEGIKVHLCFTCDPYPTIQSPPFDQRRITRHAISFLKETGNHVQILTKGGKESTQDRDLLDANDEWGVTLTLRHENESRLWEPHAAAPRMRIAALYFMRDVCPTWASLEPVIYPDQSLELLSYAIDAGISKVKVGPLNYRGRLPQWLLSSLPDYPKGTWPHFHAEVERLCAEAGVALYWKQDMKALLRGEGVKI